MLNTHTGEPMGKLRLPATPARIGTAADLTVPIASLDPDGLPSKPYVMSEALAARLGQMNPDAALREAEGLSKQRAMMADKLLGLASRGRLHELEVRAADEIRLVRARQAGAMTLLAQITYAERMAGDTSGSVALWLTVEEMERERYFPWRAWARDYPLNSRHTLEDLTLWIVEENLGIRQASDRGGMDQRRAERLLRRSLWHYATLARWTFGIAAKSGLPVISG